MRVVATTTRARSSLGFLCLAAVVSLGRGSPAQAQGCTEFLDQSAFEEFCMQHGKILKGVEDFEEAFITNFPPAAWLEDPLQGNVPNVDGGGSGFPHGLAQKNLIIQSNTLGPNAPNVSPGEGLTVWGEDAFPPFGPDSVVVGPAGATGSLDLIFDPSENHSGIGLDLSCACAAGPMFHISVFDKNNNEILRSEVPVSPDPLDNVFFGVWCDETIGRINVTVVPPSGGRFIDNIQMWLEPSCPWDCQASPDGSVGVNDFLQMLADWGGGGPCDFDGGGTGITDFLLLLGNWGPCPD